MLASSLMPSAFQSTLPREERLRSPDSLIPQRYFNPRSHERSDGQTSGYVDNGSQFQSTLPREERPMLFLDPPLLELFQSTLPREERRCVLQSGSQGLYFNPRSHERSDQDRQILFGQLYEFQSTLPREERRPASERMRVPS